jgi:hypothetical protein
MSFDLTPPFSEIVENFLAQCCQGGVGLRVSDRRLFQAFRAFWRRVAPEAAHPALLGQFRVELTERGYQSSGAKRPHWYGLALRGEGANFEQGGDAARSDRGTQGEGSALPNQDTGASRRQRESSMRRPK